MIRFAGVAWGAAVAMAFAWRYRVGAWGTQGVELIAAGAVVATAALLGRRCLDRLSGGPGRSAASLRLASASLQHPAAGWAVSAALGLGMLGMAVFALGLAGVTGRAPLAGLVAAGLALGWPAASRLAGDARRAAAGPWTAARAGRVAALAPPLGLGALLALAPPTAYDALVYHLGFPSAYLAEGRIMPLPWSVHGGFPQAGEMLYLLGWQLAGSGAAGLLHWSAYGLTGLGLYGVVAPRWGATAGRWAAALWLWTPAAGLLAGTGSVDLFVALFVLTAGALLLEERPALAGMAAGLALGTKYTAALPLAVMGGALAATRPRLALRFAAAAFLTASPWLVRNVLWYGNPVHPLLPHLFPAATASLRQAAIRYTEHVSGHGEMQGIWDWLRLPWLMVFDGVRFGGGFDQWGPWPLLAPVGLLLARRRDTIAVCVAFSVLAVLVGWGVTARVLRLLVPILPWVAILAVLPLASEYPPAHGPAPSRWFRSALMLAMVSGMAIWGFALGFVDPGPVVAGAESSSAYLHRTLGDVVTISGAVNRLIPSTGRVVWIGEPRHGLTGVPRSAPTVFDEASPPGRFTHAVVKADAPGQLPAWVMGRTVYVAGPYRLMELRPAGAR